MKAFIYTGGSVNVEGITEHPKKGDLRIAADSGYLNAKALGEDVDILLGDFDSFTQAPPKDVEVIKVPAKKDFTDTQLAVKTALEKGATDIVIIGGLSGRLDHTLSNLSILSQLWEMRIFAVMTDGDNRVRYVSSSSTLIPRSQYRYLSILAISEKLKGVDVEGCKYPLKNATLIRNDQYAISNEITENCAFISVRKGECYVIESNDG